VTLDVFISLQKYSWTRSPFGLPRPLLSVGFGNPISFITKKKLDGVIMISKSIFHERPNDS
jgi:hypothetical protein